MGAGPGLADALVAVLGLRVAGAGHRALEAALAASGEEGVDVFSRRGWRELQSSLGLTEPRARRLAAAFELGRIVERARAPADGPLLGRPGAVARLMAPELRGLRVETFHALVLDVRHRLRARVEVSRGTLASAPVHPREVFGPAVRIGGASVIVVHNHPSGDPEPSASDLEVTRRLIEAGRTLGVPLLDHLVWAQGAWVSLRERGVWSEPPQRVT